MKRIYFFIFLLSLLFVTFNIVDFYFVKRAVDFEFRVPKGIPSKRVLNMLFEEGAVKHPFLSLLYMSAVGSCVKSGCYSFHGIYSDVDIIRRLMRGSVCRVKVVVPPGANVFRVGVIVEGAGLCSKRDFLKLAFNKKFIMSLGLNASSVEGFLYPDTYFFGEDIGCEGIIRAMINNFERKLSSLFNSYKPVAYVDKAIGGFDTLKILTVASIVERETSLSYEKPLVASVIYNRLISGMPLQCDPTVYYAYYVMGISKFKLHKGDTRLDSPYNTYVNVGLPPGPICNPSVDSVLAAMYPAKTDYYYFVAKKDKRGHIFSRTYRQHLKVLKRIYGVAYRKAEKKKVCDR